MPNFDVDKIVDYLIPYREKLDQLYNWNANLSTLIALDVLSEESVLELSTKTNYQKEIYLKKVIQQKLTDTWLHDEELFDKLSLWIIREWGGIRTAQEDKTKALIKTFLTNRNFKFDRIPSTSKVAAYMFPKEYIIYDSRVAYSLNWILLSQKASDKFFPTPEGRNSKMTAFDINTLIRLKHVHQYQPKDINQLRNLKYISNIDKNLYISKDSAYSELNKLVKDISKKLWEGDQEKSTHLFYTEMLLFSIVDREIFMDITSSFVRNNQNKQETGDISPKINLPESIQGRSIFSRIIPTTCNLQNLLRALQQHNWEWFNLKDWEKREYRAYAFEEIESELQRTTPSSWPDIIKRHLLQTSVHKLGPHPMDIYLVAYFSENSFEKGKKAFTEFVKGKGISDKKNAAHAIWQVGLNDGIYLGILHKDGTVRDWGFMENFCSARRN